MIAFVKHVWRFVKVIFLWNIEQEYGGHTVFLMVIRTEQFSEIKHFIVHLLHTNYKILRLLKELEL